MIKEIQKRPFVRPLVVWIGGIVLQTYLPLRWASFLLLIIPCLLLAVPFFLRGSGDVRLAYNGRWVWGAVFGCLLLFVSIQTTAYHVEREAGEPAGRWEMAAASLRSRLLEPVGGLRLSEKEKSVLATIALGYSEWTTQEVKRQFSLTGVAHILAVSGFHVAVVGGCLYRLFAFLTAFAAGRWVRCLLTVTLVWAFTAVTGLASSAVRAALMFTLYLTGTQLRYLTDSYNTMAATAFCMLAYNPFYLYDVGFQLSYLAVVSILYLQPRMDRLIAVRNPLLKAPWQWLTVTLAAQAGVTFLCLYYFGQFSSVFLFTNLPLAGLSTLLIPLSLLWLLLPGAEGLQQAVEAVTHAMTWVVDAFGAIPGSSWTFPFTFGWMAGGYALSVALIAVWKKVVHLQRKDQMICLQR